MTRTEEGREQTGPGPGAGAETGRVVGTRTGAAMGREEGEGVKGMSYDRAGAGA